MARRPPAPSPGLGREPGEGVSAVGVGMGESAFEGVAGESVLNLKSEIPAKEKGRWLWSSLRPSVPF